MKLLIGLLAMLLPIFCGAQSPPVRALSVGDTVPDIVFNHVINYKDTTVRLSDFKGKLVILDFWATNCTACIYKFSMLDSMQRIHQNKLAVLLITSSAADTKERVNKVLDRLESINNKPLELSIILKDSVANNFFPHMYVPHYAWLDSNLQVIAITGYSDVTPDKINDVLLGKQGTFSNRNENITDFDRRKLLFENGNGGTGTMLQFRSLLSGYISGVPSKSYITMDSTGMYLKLLQINMPILNLLMRAYDYFHNSKRFHFSGLNINDINPSGKTEEWLRKHSYTYELYTSQSISKEKALQVMQQDITRYLGYSAEVKEVPTFCYVLTIDSLVLKNYRTTGGSKINNLLQPGNRYLQNRPITDIAEFLDNVLPDRIVDESKSGYNIDLTLSDKDAQEIASLSSALSKYGIHLTKSSRLLTNFFIYYHPSN